MVFVSSLCILVLSYGLLFLVKRGHFDAGFQRLLTFVNILCVVGALHALYQMSYFSLKEQVLLYVLFFFLYVSILYILLGAYHIFWKKDADGFGDLFYVLFYNIKHLIPHLRRDFWHFLAFCEIPKELLPKE